MVGSGGNPRIGTVYQGFPPLPPPPAPLPLLDQNHNNSGNAGPSIHQGGSMRGPGTGGHGGGGGGGEGWEDALGRWAPSDETSFNVK